MVLIFSGYSFILNFLEPSDLIRWIDGDETIEKVAGDIMDHFEEQVLKATDFLKALANPHRLMILCLLRDEEFAVSELEKKLDLRQPTLSQQLARLREDQLVTTRRDGKQIYYSLASDKVRRTIALLDDMFCSGALAQDDPQNGLDDRSPERLPERLKDAC